MGKIPQHIPVLLEEALSYLKGTEKVVVDATLGFGGHSRAILEMLPNATLVGIDQDEDAQKFAKENLKEFKNRVVFKKGNFSEISNLLEEEGIEKVSAVIADLGVSSYQLDEPKRGFTFRQDGPLDMRMDRSKELTAKHIVNTYWEEDLKKIFKEYGEEQFALRVARKIVLERKKKEIDTTLQLREIIISALPAPYLRSLKIDPATKIFQALRIEVNAELRTLEVFLKKAVNLLDKGGRIEIITFHSLEDRIVKNFFRELSKDCICPKEIPICVCKNKKTLKILTKKPVMGTEIEVKNNPRSRSAKLRVAEKI